MPDMNGTEVLGNAPTITFSQDFFMRPRKDQVDYLIKLASSQNQALDLMQKERDVLAQRVSVAEALAKNADEALLIQKGVVQNLITKTNSDGQDTAQRINELEAQVRRLAKESMEG